MLALLLALFAIALSVLFYLKATDSANSFYDNTYRFTRDVSEILGRVEAGFGEKLAHLDAGYSGLKSAVEKIPYDRKETETKIEVEEHQIVKLKKERDELFESLAVRAKLEEEEKRALFKKLQQQDLELSAARREMLLLRRRLKITDMRARNVVGAEISEMVIEYLKDLIRSNFGHNYNGSVSAVNNAIKRDIYEDNFPESVRDELLKGGMMDEEYVLTRKGYLFMRKIISETSELSS